MIDLFSLFAQLVGWMAMVFIVLSFQAKHRQRIILLILVGSIAWAAHFLLIGAYTGALLNLIGAARAFAFYKYGGSDSRSPWLLWGFITLFLVAGIATWQGPISILPTLGMMISNIALWQRNEQRIRLLILLVSPLWLAYNVLSGSLPGVLNECFVTSSVLIALWRYRKKPLTQKVASESLT